MARVEAIGIEVLDGRRSWKSAAKDANLASYISLRTHMANHYVAPRAASDIVLDEMDPSVAAAMRDLQEAMEYAPVEVKPLYAVAIRNLRGLMETKPSQSNLITALKAIHEITGMKMEQKLMLGFANKMFNVGPGEAAAALEKGEEVIDVEPVE